jgi:hypothetical protein
VALDVQVSSPSDQVGGSGINILSDTGGPSSGTYLATQSFRRKFFVLGPECGVETRFHFDEVGLSVFFRGLAAATVGGSSVSGTLSNPALGSVSIDNSGAVGLASGVGDGGLVWRPRGLPSLEVRLGYHFEILVPLGSSNNFLSDQPLVVHGPFAGLGYCF